MRIRETLRAAMLNHENVLDLRKFACVPRNSSFSGSDETHLLAARSICRHSEVDAAFMSVAVGAGSGGARIWTEWGRQSVPNIRRILSKSVGVDAPCS